MHHDATRNTIVCAISTPDSAHWVLARAAEEAHHRRGTRLHVLRVLEKRRFRRGPDTDELDAAMADLIDVVQRALADLQELCTDSEATCTLYVRCGDPADEIAALAAEVEADAILLGARTDSGHNVPHELIDRAECRVEIVRPKDYGTSLAPEPERSEEDTRRRSDELPLSAVLAPTSHISDRPTQFG